jgi:hypothetical protein
MFDWQRFQHVEEFPCRSQASDEAGDTEGRLKTIRSRFSHERRPFGLAAGYMLAKLGR